MKIIIKIFMPFASLATAPKMLVGISYAQLKYEGFRKRTENHCTILPGVFQVSLFIFYN